MYNTTIHNKGNFKNYIYLKYYNYLKYSSIEPEQYFNQFSRDLADKMFFTKKLTTKDKKQLENLLNFFVSPTSASQTLKKTMSEETRKKLIQAVERVFSEDYSEYNINWNNLSAQRNDLEKNYTNALNKYQNEHRSRIATWDKKIDALIKHLNSLQGVIDSGQYSELYTELLSLQQQWNNIVGSLDKAVVEKNGIRYGNLIGAENEGFAEFVKSFNRIKDCLYGNGDGDQSRATGYLLEVIGAAGALAFNGKIIESTQDIDALIKEAIVGGKNASTRKGIDITKQPQLSQAAWQEITGQELELTNNGLFAKTATQTKSDVKFILNETEINATVKNYNFKNNSHLSLVKGAPLRNLIQKDDVFLSHYLNVLSMHGYDNDDNALEPDITTQALAHQTMRKLIFARSLAGGGTYELNKDLAAQYGSQVDILIINDTSQKAGHIKIFFVKDIIAKVINDMKLTMIASKVKYKRSDGTSYVLQGYPSSDNYRFDISGWENWPWYPPTGDQGKTRIAKLYQQLYNIKIQTSLKMNLFKAKI